MLIVDILLWIVLSIAVLVGLFGIVLAFSDIEEAPLFIVAGPVLVIALLIIKLVMLS